MANIHILADPPSDYGTYSGGGWAPGLPLSNLVAQQPKQVARSLSAAAASTRFVVDLGETRQIRSFALINSNMSKTATVRFRVAAASTGTGATLDVTVPGVPPNIVFGSLPWGTLPWDGYRDDPLPSGSVVFYQHGGVSSGRYVLVDISDTANPDGYVQIGRFMAGEAFIPRFNFVYGAGFGFIDESKQTRSVGGQDWFDKKPLRRRLSWSLDAMSEGEAYGAVYDLQRKLGISGNLLVVYDPEDRVDIAQRRTIYSRMTALNDIVTANASIDAHYTAQFSVEELI